MDFSPSEELAEIAGLAREIFADLADRPDQLWTALADAGLLGLAVPEEHGGAGLDLDAACVVLEEQGRHVGDVPLWPHVVAGLVSSEELLGGLASGERRITVALEEFDGADPHTPRTRAVRDGDGWTLTGTKAVVPAFDGCSHVIVSATIDDVTIDEAAIDEATTGEDTGDATAGLFLVDATAVSWEETQTTALDRAGTLTLDATRASPLEASLDDALRWATLALCAVQLGVADGAMRIAADYTSGREQFGRPIGSFQAVQHQLADCWIDVEAMRVTLWQALDDDSERATLVAKWWCDQAGLDVVHRVQHVHGGIGVDVDYPVHRYFLWGKQISSTLGGSAAALADLGSLVAREEVRS